VACRQGQDAQDDERCTRQADRGRAGEDGGGVIAMANNWTHVFVDGRRVGFDRRDDSVVMAPDDDPDGMPTVWLGQAVYEGNRRWAVSTREGQRATVESRRAAAVWLLEATAEKRAADNARQQERDARDREAAEDAARVIRTVWPDYAAPNDALFGGAFMLSAVQMRDLLVALTAPGPRALPTPQCGQIDRVAAGRVSRAATHRVSQPCRTKR
jgi:hypothetical protein